MFVGPFCNLLFWMKPGKILMRNIGFYGNNSVFYFQLVMWAGTFSSIIVYILTQPDNIYFF
jgi:hypothetical protein